MITFKKDYTSDAERRTTSVNDISMTLDIDAGLAEILESFGDFLRGCGYHFDGHLDIIENDDDQELKFDKTEKDE